MPTAPPGYFAGLPTGYATGYHPGSGAAPPAPSTPPARWPPAHFLILCQPPVVASAPLPATFIEAIGLALQGDSVLMAMLGSDGGWPVKVFYEQARVRTRLPYLVFTDVGTDVEYETAGPDGAIPYTDRRTLQFAAFARDTVSAIAIIRRVGAAIVDAPLVFQHGELLEIRQDGGFHLIPGTVNAPGAAGRAYQAVVAFRLLYQGHYAPVLA
jgi:hypothetical protein